MKKPQELLDAEKDMVGKINLILDEFHKHAKKAVKEYCKENTYAQEKHLKHGLDFAIPKDFIVAILEDAAWQYSCMMGYPGYRSHKKNTRIIKSKIYRF
jgi:hypothetical protein